jgi:M-phase inducer tyrosine phosphatase
LQLLHVLDGQYSHLYDQHLIVDCRFPYEYEGGHIAGAVNVNTWEALESYFLEKPKQGRVVVIFHCEYSAHRAPRLFEPQLTLCLFHRALHLRNRDRHLNMHQYPKLYYPEIYILQGGYSGFFAHYKERCDPQSYVAMQDERHKATCAREMRNFGKPAKLTRTQSFTYGITTSVASGGVVFSTGIADQEQQQEDDDTMNTEDDTFEGIESRIASEMNSGVRRLPSSTAKSLFPARRAVSY